MSTEAPNYVLSPHEIVQEPERENFYYFEKIAKPQEAAPDAWRQFFSWFGDAGIKKEDVAMKGGLSKVDMSGGDFKLAYRAGLVLKEPLTRIPEGMQRGVLPGGKYARFLMTGSYSHFGAAIPAAMEAAAQSGNPCREDAFTMRQYVTEYGDVEEDQLQTHIFLPV